MKYIKIIFIMLSALIIISCPYHLDDIDQNNEVEYSFVRVYIGEDILSARSIQPNREAIEGYQLTFSGSSTHNPVDIPESNYVDLSLANGTWTITAKAYKLGGIIGNNDDVIASGSITITISNGVVSGTVPPIILTSGGIGNGILNYNVTVNSGIFGKMSLWEIDGITPVISFGNDGVLSLSNSVSDNFTIISGRYIIEVRLLNPHGKIAIYREIIDIWTETTTFLVFEPTVFFDPNMVPVNYGSFNVVGSSAGISYTDGILTISESGSYTISMRPGVTSTAVDRIFVSNGVNADISLLNVSINSNFSAFLVRSDSIVYLTLIGNNRFHATATNSDGFHVSAGATLVITEESSGSLTASGGYGAEGIGVSGTIIINGGTVTAIGGRTGAGIGGDSSGTIIINGGTVTATGNEHGAGIGGGRRGAGGTINITGGIITATGNLNAAGIGGGGTDLSSYKGGAGGTISITGGIITATSTHNTAGTGIGSGIYGDDANIVKLSGNAVVFASSFRATLPSGVNLGPSIIFNGNEGIMYGNVTLERNVTIPSGKILGIRSGQTLHIADGYILTNNGAIIVNSGGNIETVSRVIGNLPEFNSDIIFQEEIPSFKISGGSAYTYTGNILTITGSGTYYISMREGKISTSSERIVVNSGINANITLTDVRIDRSFNDVSAFDMTGATVNLTLIGNNILKSGYGMAGIEVSEGTLVITEASGGSLDVTGGHRGAGIGSLNFYSPSSISIRGGIINATGGTGAAGIGDASTGYVKNYSGIINISGGTVSADGGSAGIGSTGSEFGGIINISGGIITTSKIGNSSSGVGGFVGRYGTINISGGDITATRIGGNSTAGTTININGGIINADTIGSKYDSSTNHYANSIINVVNGNAVIFAFSIVNDLPTGANLGPAIVFNGVEGIMYGNARLSKNITIPSGRILSIKNGQILTIENGYTLTNNGEIVKVNGGSISGNIYGNQPILKDDFTALFTTLDENIWTDGNITSLNKYLWYKFTATADTQCIHVNFGTLTNIAINVYDNNLNIVGGRSILTGSTKFISRTLISGKEYYIFITPSSSSGNGTYQIAFNKTAILPGVAVTALNANIWTDGNISSSNSDQWFTFTATAVTQYIHAKFNTSMGLYVQLYDKNFDYIGVQEIISSDFISRFISRTVTIGQVYYIRLFPSGTGRGEYQVTFNTTGIPPGTNVTSLNTNSWSDWNYISSNDDHWFTFTATNNSHYIHTPNTSVFYQVYDSNFNTIFSSNIGGDGIYAITARFTLTNGQKYYIRVNLNGAYSGASYRIAFNNSDTAPL